MYEICGEVIPLVQHGGGHHDELDCPPGFAAVRRVTEVYSEARVRKDIVHLYGTRGLHFHEQEREVCELGFNKEPEAEPMGSLAYVDK